MKARTDTHIWDERRGVIRSRKGGWRVGEGVYSHGYSMLDELVGQASYFQILILNATGRMPEKRLADWLEAAFMCLSWPDARIWCNLMGSLAGTVRASPVMGIAAGMMASDSNLYGPGTTLGGMSFIQHALVLHKQGQSVAQIIKTEYQKGNNKPSIYGYGRPIAKGDERIVAMECTAKKLGFEIGEHLSFAYQIQDYMVERHDESMNMLGYLAAFLSDQGYTGKDMYLLFSSCVNAGVHACYAEARDNNPMVFLPLMCEDISYQGKGIRNLDRR